MKNVLLLTSVTLLLMSAAARAQSVGAQTASNAAAGGSDSGGLDEIVVTATRREQKLKDVPLTVTAISGPDLQNAGVDGIRDLQNVVSGLTFGGLGTVSQPAIRGVSTTLSTAGAENPNALYVDGVYQLDQVTLNEDMPDVESLEVLKGPQGTLFGRNATGGAILITTKAPSFTPGGDFTLESGYYTGSGTSHSSPHEDVKGFVTGPIVPGLLAGSLSAGYDYTTGYLTDDVTNMETGLIDKKNVRGKLLFTPNSISRITLTGFYVNDNDQGLLDGVPLPGLSAGDFFPGSIVPTQPYHVASSPGFLVAGAEQYGGSIDAVFDFDVGTLRSISAYERTFTHNLNSTSGAAGSLACLQSFACIDYDFAVEDHEVSQEFNFTSHKFGIFNFVSGLYFFDAHGTTLSNIQATIIPGGLSSEDDDIHTRSWAVYSEGNAAVTDRLTLTAGLRYSDEPHTDQAFPVAEQGVPATISRTFDSLTPRASAMYALTPELNVYATYAKGFKSGLTGVTNIATTPPYAAVQPETLTSYETGLKYASRLLTLNGSFFFYKYQNKQEETFTGVSTVVQNTGPVKIYGVDLDGNFQMTQDFRINGNLTYIPEAKYQDFPNASGQSTVFSIACGGFCPGTGSTAAGSFNATGERLIRTPEVTADGTLSYKHTLTGGVIDASATASFSTAVLLDITDTIRQPAYVIANVQGGYRFAGTGLRVGLYVHNVTDKAFLMNGLTSSAGFVAGYNQPREVGLSLNYSF
jgi:iron complex outermembrane recepter protein